MQGDGFLPIRFYLLAESILQPEPQGSKEKNVFFRFPASAVQGKTLEVGINTV